MPPLPAELEELEVLLLVATELDVATLLEVLLELEVATLVATLVDTLELVALPTMP